MTLVAHERVTGGDEDDGASLVDEETVGDTEDEGLFVDDVSDTCVREACSVLSTHGEE